MNARILVVEDNKGLNILFRKILGREEFRVISAGDGAEAFELLSEGEEVNIILLDIMMPKLDGMGFLEKAREIIQKREIKVCMISALSDNKRIQKCLDLGADDYIIKSADEELLVNKMQFLSGLMPIYEYAKITCKRDESFHFGSNRFEVLLTEINEDYFVFNVNQTVKCGQRIKISQGKIMEMTKNSQPILARIFRVNRTGEGYICYANYIGLTENQIKLIRSKTLTGRDAA